MMAIANSLPVKEGAADRIVDRIAGGRDNVRGFPVFVSTKVLESDDGDEVLVVTRWRDRASFDAWLRGGGEGLLRGHPKVTTYEVAVEREPEAYGPD
jgi:heme-degrading monooxygenase HmoA